MKQRNLKALLLSMGLILSSHSMEVERTHYYGLNLDTIESDLIELQNHEKFATLTLEKQVQLPESVDLRAGCSPVRNQEQLGSCTAFAGSGLVEYLLKKQGLEVEERSELFLYYVERLLGGTVDKDSGSSMSTIVKATHQYGSCPEKLWDYTDYQKKFTERPSDQCFEEAKKCVDLDKFNHTIVKQDLVPLRELLAQGNPFVIGIGVWESFESKEVAQTGIVPMPNTKTEKLLGGHALMVVGYDDKTQRFLVRNSWGADWGDKGYCTLPYEYLTNTETTQGIFTMFQLGESKTPNKINTSNTYCSIF